MSNSHPPVFMFRTEPREADWHYSGQKAHDEHLQDQAVFRCKLLGAALLERSGAAGRVIAAQMPGTQVACGGRGSWKAYTPGQC